jgi:hypothetical protein
MTHATLERQARGVAPHEHEEGTITKTIEQYTSAVPSGVYRCCPNGRTSNPTLEKTPTL